VFAVLLETLFFMPIRKKGVLVVGVGVLLSSVAVITLVHTSFHGIAFINVISSVAFPEPKKSQKSRCAILFFGLPRSYEFLVLPSIVHNVLAHNMCCDVYAHSIIRREEPPGRSGSGGSIDPNALSLLKKKVHELHKGPPPHVYIYEETEDDFWTKRNATINMYRTAKGADGKLLYYPWKTHFNTETVDNIIRQWHSVESVWQLMEKGAKILRVKYDHVCILRSDVFFATPIQMCSNVSATKATYPGFGLWPVNDRMICGPHNAVKIWASQRFSRLVSDINKLPPGRALHPETFLDRVIFPAIRENGTEVTQDPNICFFRVRSDMSMWVNDCLRARTPGGPEPLGDVEWADQQILMVQSIVGLQCQLKPYSKVIRQLVCRNDSLQL